MPVLASESDGYCENWIVYGANDFCAKELTVNPKCTVTLTEAAANGVTITNDSEFDDLVMLKHFGPDNSEAAHLIRKYR